jgi:hypothetical protein
MKDEDIIRFHPRLYPFQAKRMDWRRFGLLTQGQRIPAPELTALSQPADHEWKPISRAAFAVATSNVAQP